MAVSVPNINLNLMQETPVNSGQTVSAVEGEFSFDNILADIRITSDYNKQRENYNKLYDEYLNGFPYVFLYRSTSSVIYNQTLCGKISPNNYSIFYNIEKWYRQ